MDCVPNTYQPEVDVAGSNQWGFLSWLGYKLIQGRHITTCM
jgi:hypothetical protein